MSWPAHRGKSLGTPRINSVSSSSSFKASTLLFEPSPLLQLALLFPAFLWKIDILFALVILAAAVLCAIPIYPIIQSDVGRAERAG